MIATIVLTRQGPPQAQDDRRFFNFLLLANNTLYVHSIGAFLAGFDGEAHAVAVLDFVDEAGVVHEDFLVGAIGDDEAKAFGIVVEFDSAGEHGVKRVGNGNKGKGTLGVRLPDNGKVGLPNQARWASRLKTSLASRRIGSIAALYGPTPRRSSFIFMKSEENNQQAGTNDVAGNVGAATPAANTKMGPGAQNTLANSLTQSETPAMQPGSPASDATPASGPPPKAGVSSQALAASEMSVGQGAAAGEGEKQETREASPADLTAAGASANRRGRKPGTPNKPKDGAPSAATKAGATKAGNSTLGRPRKAVPEASSDQQRRPDTYGGNFGNDVQNSFRDQDRYQNQVSGASRGEFGTQSQQGGTHGGFGNQYRELDFEGRNSAEDRYYGGPGRYGQQHNAYRDYDGRDERGGQGYRSSDRYDEGYGNQNGGRGQYGGYDDHGYGYDRHGFNQQGGHYYGPGEGYNPRHAGGYDERERRPAGRAQGGYGTYSSRNRGDYQNDNRYQQAPQQRGYDDGRGNRQDNRNQPDRDDRRANFQNDNGAGPGRGQGYASDYGRSSFGGSGNGRDRDQRADGGAGYERRNQGEDGRSSRGGYDNQGSGGGRVGHRSDEGRYGQQGYQSGYGTGADERGRYQQGGPAQDQQGDSRRQPTEGYGYGYGRDERSEQGDYRTGDQRNGYGRSYGGDSGQGYGSRGGSYNDEYDNANGGVGPLNGSPAQGDYTRQDRDRNYGPDARQQFRADKPDGEEGDYGSTPRRNRGRDGEHDE